jgi:ferredoxin-NADP reductase
MDAATSAEILGFVILTAVSVWTVVNGIGAVRRMHRERRQHNLACALLREKIRLARAQNLEKTVDLAWRGFRKFEVVRKESEAEDTVSLYLAPHDRKPIPRFEAGQFLTFRVSVPGTDRPVIRCYSLSADYHPDYYRITVKRVSAVSGEPGVASTFMTERLAPGDILDISAPRGAFVLDLAAQRPVVFIAGGIGVTPLFTTISALIRTRATREVWFFLGTRHGGTHLFREPLQRIANDHAHVNLHVCYSAPRAEDTLGVDYHGQGRISVELVKKLLPSSNYEFRICGPPPLMESVTRDLAAWGVPAEDIFVEAFGPESVKRVEEGQGKRAETDDSRKVSVTFARSRKVVTGTTTTNLLELAEQHAIKIDFGCRAGDCNTCLTAVKAGEVAYVKTPGSQPEVGSCLPCICVPAGDLTLDA